MYMSGDPVQLADLHGRVPRHVGLQLINKLHIYIYIYIYTHTYIHTINIVIIVILLLLLLIILMIIMIAINSRPPTSPGSSSAPPSRSPRA